MNPQTSPVLQLSRRWLWLLYILTWCGLLEELPPLRRRKTNERELELLSRGDWGLGLAFGVVSPEYGRAVPRGRQ